MNSFFEREVKRLQYVQERKKIRVQEKAAYDGALQELAAVSRLFFPFHTIKGRQIKGRWSRSRIRKQGG